MILFKNVTAVLMDGAHTVLPNAFVAVEGNKIASVGTSRPEGPFEREIHGRGGILMPGPQLIRDDIEFQVMPP